MMVRQHLPVVQDRPLQSRWARAGGVIVILVLAAVACAPPASDSGSSDTSGGSAASESADKGPIIVGSGMPLTGPYASDGEQMELTLETAIEEKNAEGGLLGRELKLVTGDVGALEVDRIQAVAERLLGENPDVIMTSYDDSGVNVHAFGEGDMPYLHAVAMRAAVDAVRENPDKYSNVFQYDPSDYDYGVDAAEMLPQVAEQLEFEPANKSVAIVTTDFSYNIVGAEAFEEKMKEQGYEIAVKEVTPFGVEEWGPVLSRIKREEPAFITFWNLDPADAGRFMNQFAEHFSGGLNSLLYMQYTPYIPEFAELTGSRSEGLLYSTVIGTGEGFGRDREDYEQRWEERHGEPPNSVHPYILRDAFDLWVSAVEEVGCVDCFDKVNETIRNIEFEGYAGTYKFEPEGQSALAGPEYLPTIWSQVQDGEPVVVLPTDFSEKPVMMPPWVRESN